MKFFFYVLVITVLLEYPFNAQGKEKGIIDSLHTELKVAEQDTNQVLLLLTISDEYYDDVDSAIFYANKALRSARDIGWDNGTSAAYLQLGSIYLEKNRDYHKAVEYTQKALDGYKKLEDTLNMGYCYANLGRVYDYEYKFSDALQYYFKSLNIARSKDDKDLQLTNLVNIGNVYGMVEEKEKSLDYYRKALEINKELGYEYDEALLLINMAVEYSSDNELDMALEYNNKAIDILKKIDEDFLVAHTLSNNGLIYMEKGKYTRALRTLQQADSVFRKEGDKAYIAGSLLNIGSVYLGVAMDTTGFVPGGDLIPAGRNENIDLALKHFLAAKHMFDNGEVDDIGSLMHLHELLSKAYEAKGNIAEAFASYKQYRILEDSLLAQEDDKKIAQLEGQRTIALKDKELELQKLLVTKRRNERWFLMGGMVLLCGVLGITYHHYRQRGVSNKLLATEKKKSEDLLLNILPEEVAEELKENGKANAMHFDAVTVLFTDFVNFTKAGERMSSQELVDELHSCFKAFDEITGRYGIEKIKTIGDAYLAVSGLPVAEEKHAENVVLAAIDILAFMKKRRGQLGDRTFEIRIGIHSGDVVAGIVGVKKFAYDIWGDTVNTAARMEQSGEPGKINISETTYLLVKDKFRCSYRGEFDAKNKGQLKMYFIEA